MSGLDVYVLIENEFSSKYVRGVYSSLEVAKKAGRRWFKTANDGWSEKVSDFTWGFERWRIGNDEWGFMIERWGVSNTP